MKFLIIILIFLLSACNSNKDNQTNLFKNDIFLMTIEKYKEMLIDYNSKKEYPNIDN